VILKDFKNILELSNFSLWLSSPWERQELTNVDILGKV
jgi:hypothetical protein